MNNLFSNSFARFSGDVEMQSQPSNLDKFFEDVEAIKTELASLDELERRLRDANEAAKTLHRAEDVRANRAQMEADVTTCLKKAKFVKLRLEALDRANAANRALPGCGPGSGTDRTRTSVVAGLRKKLIENMEGFNQVRERAAVDYREAVQRRYYTVTGGQPDDATLDALISTGEAERFLQRAIQETGRGEVMEVVTEIRERHGASKELEKSLVELHQVFLDMSVLVQAQGEQLDDIESHVGRASSFVRGGTEQLVTARQHQKSSRKWACIGIIILLVIILIIVLSVVLNNRGSRNNSGNK